MALTPQQLEAARNLLRAVSTPDEKRKVALAAQLAKREAVKAKILGRFHPGQKRAYKLLKTGKYTALCAGRRSGKTDFDAAVITEALIDAGKDEWVIFMASTAQAGKELIWSDLERLNTEHDLRWKMDTHPVPMITTPAGARFKVVGCNDKGELDKLRGKKYPLVVIDEAKDLTLYLKELIQEVIAPAFMGVGGRVLVTGTPGRVCDSSDFWYAICHGMVPGWKAEMGWTIRDNPWFKEPEAELAQARADNDWAPDNVVYLREYEGRWVSDDGERVYAYLAGRNSVAGLPAHYDRAKWYHVMGVDIGFSPDPCAWVVLACHPNEKDVYVVHAEKRGGMFSDEVAEYTGELSKRYRCSAVVGDAGGQGKPYIADMNQRHAHLLGVHVKQAEKTGRRDQIEIVSEELKAGRLKLCLPNAQELATEYVNLGWKDSRREEQHPTTPKHCADAARYAHKELKAYWHKPAPAVPTADQREIEARRARQRKARQRQQGGFFGRTG